MSEGHSVYRRVLAATCSMALLSGCGESRNPRSESKAVESKEQQTRVNEDRQRLVADLARQHNADISWSSTRFTWTADVQERLMRADSRPIVGIAKFVDFERQGSGYLLRLRHGRILEAPVEFRLKTSRVERPKKEPRFVDEGTVSVLAADYVFVARIQRVLRVDTSTGGRRWLAEGECLDLREAPALVGASGTNAPTPKSKLPNPIPQ